jgi:hypothetical protein
VSTPTITPLPEELASRFDVIDTELRAGVTIVAGLVHLQSAETVQPGVLGDLALPLGREGVALHLVEVLHFLHTADRHGIDILREMNYLVHDRSEEKERSEASREETNRNLDDAMAASDEGLSIALSAVERLRAEQLQPGESSPELALEMKKVETFCEGAEATHKMLHAVRDVVEGRSTHEMLGVRVLQGEEAVRWLREQGLHVPPGMVRDEQ